MLTKEFGHSRSPDFIRLQSIKKLSEVLLIKVEQKLFFDKMRVMNRKYDDEFKRQTVKKVLDGQSVSSVSRKLGVEMVKFKWNKNSLFLHYF